MDSIVHNMKKNMTPVIWYYQYISNNKILPNQWGLYTPFPFPLRMPHWYPESVITQRVESDIQILTTIISHI